MKHLTMIKVRGYHLDLYGHVNNARYLEFLEEARWTFFEDRGDLPAFLASGIAMVVVNININYRHPATMGDSLAIETNVASLNTRSGVIHQRITIAGTDKLVADADVTFVLFDPRKGKAIALEGEVRAMLEALQPA